MTQVRETAEEVLQRTCRWFRYGGDDELDRKAAAGVSGPLYRVTHYSRDRFGFTATMATELEALRFAHAWRGSEVVSVSENKVLGLWSVRIALVNGWAVKKKGN